MANGITEQRDQLIADLEDEMMLWVKGERTHWNYYCSIVSSPADASALCSVADAAEVQKYSAAILALRSGQ